MLKRYKLLVAMSLSIAAFLIPYKASAAPVSVRFAGIDRYDTAIKISQNSWTQSDNVVIASGDDFPDGLCAAPLAKKYNAPILLTPRSGLRADVLQEIQRLGAKNAFIVGGTSVVPSSVEGTLSKLNITSTRFQGQDRYETSAKVAQAIGTSNGVVIASGENFPDALSIAPIAAAKQMPILLTTAKALPTSIKNIALSGSVSNYYVVGGSGVISDNAVATLTGYKRLSGINRYETNLAVINEFSSTINFSTLFVSTGNDFADALSGSAAAAETSSALILTDGSDPNTETFVQLKYDSISSVKVLGGTKAVPDSIVQAYITDPSKSVLGFATYYSSGDTSSYNSLTAHSSLIDQIATDTYNMDGSGNLYYGYTSNNVGLLPTNQINYANSNNIDAYAMVVNFDGSVLKTFLENPTSRANLINKVLQAVKTNNFKGANIDFEGVYAADRPYLTTFMSELYNTLHPLGYKVTIDVPAKTVDSLTNSWTGAFDYAQIANYSDEVILMTYDEHYAGGSAGPIASAGWVQNVVNYTVTTMPSRKIILGLAAYGYDWSSNGGTAKAYAESSIYNLANNYGAKINWDSTSESNYFNYTDSSSINHSVWFENGTSISYKLDMVNNNKLGGVAIWRLGFEDSDYWATIKSKLNK